MHLAVTALLAAATVAVAVWSFAANSDAAFGWAVVLLAVTLLVGARGNLDA